MAKTTFTGKRTPKIKKARKAPGTKPRSSRWQTYTGQR